MGKNKVIHISNLLFERLDADRTLEDGTKKTWNTELEELIKIKEKIKEKGCELCHLM